MGERFYVQIDRDDGSRTYKGAWSLAHCDREAAAWRAEFPGYGVTVAPVSTLSVDFGAWSRVVRTGARYYPRNDEAGGYWDGHAHGVSMRRRGFPFDRAGVRDNAEHDAFWAGYRDGYQSVRDS